MYNRRYFDDVLSGLEGTYSFAMLDMDNFKQINDSFGHAAGDAALAAAAGTLKECMGDSGEVIRYGGDEFFMLFGTMRESDMEKMLAEILQRVEDIRLDEYPELKMTISIGGATAEGKLSRSIRKADVAMYRAKNIRNSVEMYED